MSPLIGYHPKSRFLALIQSMNAFPPVEVLLVEDNPCDAELTLQVLKDRNLVRHCVHVRDGQEAIDYLFLDSICAGRANRLPRVVLLDMKLPRVDGIEVLRRIREDSRTCRLPVVVFTSSSQEQDVIAAYNLGVNSFIVKPVDYKEFSEVIAQLGHYWLLLNHAPVS